MDSTLEQFHAKRTNALNLLRRLQEFLAQGAELGVAIDPSLMSKLANATEHLAHNKLTIALIGGFSEGKTSIAAAWMERLDQSSMRISQQESSDEVKVYEVGEDFVLIDTPGLFGFKEKYNADIRAIEKYKDITRKYVSEAHLVLYVMNSTNPVKESHTDDLLWLFRTLDLLPRTVFVLSRFDEVADVQDEGIYQEKLQIKRENVQGRLRAAIGASDEELSDLSIVAVSANPFDLGTEHWLGHPQEFKALSHIGSLQQATMAKIKESGGALAIVEEARRTVIRDVLHKELPVAEESHERLGREVKQLKEMERTLRAQFQTVSGQISEARISLRDFVSRYFSDLILRTKGLTQETFGEFMEREIGADGVNVSTRLQSEFERQLNGVSQEIGRMCLSFDSEIGHFNTTVIKFGKQGVSYLVKGNFINNTNILAARDGIVTLAKTLGMDMSKMLKFKPWGAIKLADGLNGALALVGLLFEAWDSYEQSKRQKVFEQVKIKIVENFEGQRKELLALLDSGSFVPQFFPDYSHLKEGMAEVQEAVAHQEFLQERFQQWRSAGEAIEGEFTLLDS